MVTLPLKPAAMYLILLPATLEVLNDDPAPPEAVVVVVRLAVLVLVVVWLRLPLPITEFFSSASILLSVLPEIVFGVVRVLGAAGLGVGVLWCCRHPCWWH